MSTKKPTGVTQRHRTRCAKSGRCGCPWAFEVELPAGADGSRRRVTKSGYAGQREAKKARDAVIAEERSGTLTDDRSLTVAVYLRRWLARKVDTGSIRPATVASYTRHVELLVAEIGHHRLHELRAHHIEAGYRKIAKANPAMGPASLVRLHATLRSALRAAVKRREGLTHDPCQHVELPKARRPRVQVWSVPQWQTFMSCPAVAEHPMKPLFEVAALTGMRRGELVELQWSDIDLAAGVVTVKRQAVVVGHEVIVGPPKTASGDHRLVDLDAGTVELLKRLKRSQARQRLALGPAWLDDEGHVFTREDGAPWHPERVTKTFVRLAKAGGLEPCRFHDLRHLQASLMLAAGVEVGIVSKRLGHSTVTLTSDTYSHLMPGVGKAAAEAAAGLLSDASSG
ncbi:tyrosine-type recombinase/integrase [Jiangella asiatica]|uniref:Site-specific integrase n=1 Tax=Jiangella asiatica TaxID=2530372 RepID=A0A4R5DJB5_9ACTN|nr:site-specific integrase [Jiangella asiatica]TDE10653.1 site-specific integrase [Jiangella asiatica]